jgi:hypothetical protein
MAASRFVALPLVLLAAACSTRRVEGPRPLVPERGPDASVRVGYTGGLLNRSLTAYFRTEQNAYVIVAHLGGDGIIRVLYPEAPYAQGWVAARKTLRTATFQAPYDAIPSLFSYSVSQYRNGSARYSSYDGRGHGYVFIVASRRPLSYSLLEDPGSGEWSEWQVSDYAQSPDPRYAIRDFADAVAHGGGYTLKYAGALSTSQYDALASRYWDCAMLSSLGSLAYGVWAPMSLYSPLYALEDLPSSYCGSNAYSRYRYAVGNAYGPATPTTSIIPTVPTPTSPTPAPTLHRPGRRGLGPTTTVTTLATRQTITRVAPGTSTGEVGSSRGRPTYSTGHPGYEPSRRDVSTPREYDRTHTTEARGSSGSSSSSGATRETGSSSTATPSRSAEGRGVASPREARTERPPQ